MKTNLSEKQSQKLAAAEARLPDGYSYRLHDDGSKVWGVTVYRADENGHEEGVGHVQAPTDGWLQAHTTCKPEDRAAVRLMLNRAAAALWHKQPNWGTASQA